MMLHLKQFIFVLFTATVLCSDKDDEPSTNFAVELNSNNFKDALADKNHFIMFYAPWCGHSKKLFPIWEQLAETFNLRSEPRVIIAKVDCTENHELCVQNEVTGYPTLKFFKANAIDSTKFKGIRDLQTITNFINELLGDTKATSDEADDTQESEVLQQLTELTDDTFAKHVAIGKHFVKFYAPWCGHCQRLAPTWEELANSLAHDTKVKISKIDCTVYRPICQDFEVKGYPTLLWIEDGKKIEKYSGGRSHEDLKAYVNKMAGTVSSKPTSDEIQGDSSNVVILSSNNFEHAIEKGITFVKFYAPWCGHCQKMAPIWEELAVKFIGNSQVKIAKVDCTIPSNKELCMGQQVEGYPTLFIYNKGKKVIEYNGSRQLSDMYEFVLQHASKHDEL